MDGSIKLISTLKDLPLSKFIDCCIHQEYEVLILSGHDVVELTQPELDSIYMQWVKLLSEFWKLSGDNEQEKKFILIAKIAKAKAKQKHVLLMIDTVRRLREFELDYQFTIDSLKYFYPLRQFSEKTLEADLKFCNNSEISQKLVIREMEAELEKMSRKTGEVASEASFFERLLTYEEVAKVPVMDKENMSTFMYALYMKRLNEKIKSLSHAR